MSVQDWKHSPRENLTADPSIAKAMEEDRKWITQCVSEAASRVVADMLASYESRLAALEARLASPERNRSEGH